MALGPGIMPQMCIRDRSYGVAFSALTLLFLIVILDAADLLFSHPVEVRAQHLVALFFGPAERRIVSPKDWDVVRSWLAAVHQ